MKVLSDRRVQRIHIAELLLLAKCKSNQGGWNGQGM